MVNSNTNRAAADLQRLAQRFAAWRSRREIGARIPAPLWWAAVTLACGHGVSRTATTLGLGYYSLQERVEAHRVHQGTANRTSGGPTTASGRKPAFVELPASRPGLESPPRSAFVELPAAARDGALAALPHAALRVVSHDVASPTGAERAARRGCLIEWTGASGDTLRIQLTSHDVSEIAALCRELGSGS